MDVNKKETLLITCARGIVPYLRSEVEQLGYNVQSAHDTGVEIIASLLDAHKLNLKLRTAFNVLYLLKNFSCTNPDELYCELVSLPWEDIIVPEEYLTVLSRVETSSINNSVFASQKVKDAIVDRISDKCGRRPSAGPKKDNVVINL